MKKWTSSIVAVTMLTACLPIHSMAAAKTTETASVSAKTQAQGSKHHLNLKLNLSDPALDWMTRDQITKANGRIFKEKLEDKGVPGNLELTFETQASQLAGYDDITGHGVIRVGNVTGTVDLKDDIQKFTTSNGMTVYSSPVEATFKFGNETYNGLVGLTYNPVTDSALVSLSIGAISDQGTGMVFFGEPFMEMSEVKQQMLKQLKGNSEKMEPLKSDQRVEGLESQPSEMAVAATTGTEYTYRTSADNMYLRYTSESSPGYVGKSVVGLNVYDRDPSVNANGLGMVQVRAWSNNQAVINYANAKDPYHFNTTSYVYEGFISLNTNYSEIGIHTAGPSDGETIEKWDFLANVPLIGNALDFIANSYVALYNNSIKITSTKTKSTSSDFYTYWRKNMKTLGTSADLPYMSDTAYSRRGQKEGGVSAFFYYFDYTSGIRTLTAGARMDYMVDSGNLYWGVFYSESAVANWSANFM